MKLQHITLFFTFTFIFCFFSSAQLFQHNYIKYSDSGIGSGSGSDLIDWDGDGKLDMLGGMFEKKHLLWAKNEGNTFSINALADSVNGYIFFKKIDFNQDGFEDILVVRKDRGNRHQIALHLNDGNFNYSVHHVFSTSFDFITRIDAADMDNDGDLDFLVDVGGSTSFLWLVTNQGNFQFTGSFVSFFGQSAQLFGIADFNNDSLPDFVASYRDFNVNDYILLAAERDTQAMEGFVFHPIDTFSDIRNAVVGNFIGSADADVFLSTTVSTDKATLWRHDGNFRFRDVAQPTVPRGAFFYLPNDYDKDNDLDVIMLGFNGNQLLVNNGNGNFSTQQTFINGFIGTPTAWEDVDGDGRKDIHTTGGGSMAVWTQNAGGTTYDPYWSISDPGGEMLQILDVDLDGQLDILSAEDEELRVMRQTFDEKILPTENYIPTGIPFNFDPYTDMIQLDRDGDGDMDILAGYESTLYWLNNNQGTFSSSSVVSTNLGFTRKYKRGDLDRDGNPDILMRSIGVNRLVRLEWNGNAFSQAQFSNNPYNYDLGDIDNDNDDDVVYLESSLPNNRLELRYFRNNNNNFSDIFIRSLSPMIGRSAANFESSIEAGDIDKDGDRDFFVCSFNEDKIVWLRNDSNLVFTDFLLTDSISEPVNLHVADMDNDNDNDIVVASLNFGEIFLFTNDGNSNFTQSLITDEAVYPEHMEVIDIDQDGDMDVVTVSRFDDMLIIMENTTINCTRSFTQDSISICQGDSVLIGNIWRQTAGTYQDTLSNSQGCDSLVSIQLATVQASGQDNISICFGDSVQIGNVWRNTAGTYQDTLSTSQGCDSIVSIQLAVTSMPSMGQEMICPGDSLLIGNLWVKNPGTYTDTLTGVNGCDSLHRIDLTLFSLPNIQLGSDTNVVFVQAPLTSIQWFKDDSLLMGATGDSLDLLIYGSGAYYLTGLTSNGCLVSSDTLELMVINLSLSAAFEDKLDIFPNPVSDELMLSSQSLQLEKAEISFFSAAGKKVVMSEKRLISANQLKFSVKQLPQGIYYIKIQLDDQWVYRRFVKM